MTGGGAGDRAGSADAPWPRPLRPFLAIYQNIYTTPSRQQTVAPAAATGFECLNLNVFHRPGTSVPIIRVIEQTADSSQEQDSVWTLFCGPLLLLPAPAVSINTGSYGT